jgi:hypothetical protein
MKPFDPSEVVSSAIYNFTLLENALFSFARREFSEETFNYLSNLNFVPAAKTVQAILRECRNEEELVQTLNEAIGVYKHRNKIAHNPLVLSLQANESSVTTSHILFDSKKGVPIEGYSLKEINDYGVKANMIAGKIFERKLQSELPSGT